LTRPMLENKDTMTCTLKGPEDGIVCDWRINEVRHASKAHAGCKMTKNNGKEECKLAVDEAKCAKKGWDAEKCAEKGWSEDKCAEKGGTWDVLCEMEQIENGFGYDSFGSYYLVHDRTKCTQESTGDYCPNANDRPDPQDNCTEGEDCTQAPTALTVAPAPTSTPAGCYDMGPHKCNCDADSCNQALCEAQENHFWTTTCPDPCDPATCDSQQQP